MLDTVNRYLDSRGIRIATGAIVDATILDAPSSTKNAQGARDPEMRQTRKGNQWYFGMKAHISVDSKTGLVHSVCTMAASVSDGICYPSRCIKRGARCRTTAGIRVRVRRSARPHRALRCRDYVDQLQRAKNRVKVRVREG